MLYTQSTLVISKSKGPTKTLRDISTSTYQICSIEEKTIRTTKFHKCLYNVTSLVEIYIENIVDKGRAISTLFHNIL